MVNAMKLISSYTFGNYNKDIFKFSKKLLIYSLIIFIIGFLIIIFKLSFCCRINYIIEKKDKNFYQVIVPYQDLSVWMNNDRFYYNKDSTLYSIKEIVEDTIFQNEKVYLQLLIEVDKLNESIPLIEVSLENEEITLWDYLNKKFRGK